MSWFKVDDKFHGSKEVKLIPREHRAAAIGLWTLAGSWCSDHLNDGWVPDYMLDEFAATVEHAEALVTAKLWTRRRGGYQFRNWAKWQQTRADVLEKRAAVTERVRKHRERKAGTPGDDNDGVTRYEGDETHPPSRPVPSRPEPLIDQSSGEVDSGAPGTGRTGDNPVESVDNLDKIAERITKLTGERVGRLEAKVAAEHYLDRAKSWPANPTRFVLVCLTREEPLVLVNFAQTGRWSS